MFYECPYNRQKRTNRGRENATRWQRDYNDKATSHKMSRISGRY